MRLWGMRKGGPAAPARSEQRERMQATKAHLEDFVRTRVGVEAFLEPPTTMNPPTVLLIATTGEWTRRRVPDPSVVRDLAARLSVPVYDVQLVGYPQRMRDWNDKVKRERQAPPAEG